MVGAILRLRYPPAPRRNSQPRDQIGPGPALVVDQDLRRGQLAHRHSTRASGVESGGDGGDRGGGLARRERSRLAYYGVGTRRRDIAGQQPQAAVLLAVRPHRDDPRMIEPGGGGRGLSEGLPIGGVLASRLRDQQQDVLLGGLRGLHQVDLSGLVDVEGSDDAQTRESLSRTKHGVSLTAPRRPRAGQCGTVR
ncbi:hypothetical protein C6V83_11225 [Gordonia iterans]|uniref:Uncharacterized protein n=1 Tax=Gordonia iterans TaxID=1004901 RepID=A0A2S0KGC8_9ACTN|nr:hypothetical protein C6V83_11225 [Gordonia iterans]